MQVLVRHKIVDSNSTQTAKFYSRERCDFSRNTSAWIIVGSSPTSGAKLNMCLWPNRIRQEPSKFPTGGSSPSKCTKFVDIGAVIA